MKKLIILIALFLGGATMYGQKSILDSVQIYTAYPNKPAIVGTVYEVKDLYSTMTKISDSMAVNTFIVKVFFKEEKDGPQFRHTMIMKRKVGVKE